ncbi:MAG TPA: GNAT family N-acetyltransferase [Caulobacteraceae bacterium]|jgi:aminoglycoside 6'-N-acetyltransferase|nr:GNAT family N-acetyltransferase [Caulobacteraceae bacterium]
MSAPGRGGSPTVEFRPLAFADCRLLTRWLMAPHVRRFYQKEPITLAEVEAEYGPTIRGEEPSLSHIASSAGAPFGYIQCYANMAYPEYAETIGVDHGISVDLYVGEPAFVGRGFGRAMLASYLAQVAFAAYPDEDLAYIAHEPANLAALACSQAVGFKPLRQIVEDGVVDQLLVVSRADLAESLRCG